MTRGRPRRQFRSDPEGAIIRQRLAPARELRSLGPTAAEKEEEEEAMVRIYRIMIQGRAEVPRHQRVITVEPRGVTVVR